MAVIGNSPTHARIFKLDQILGTGDSSYTLTYNGNQERNLIAEQLIVSINGTIQNPNSAFTLSGPTITFAEAIDSDDTIDFITVIGESHNVATVSDGGVTANKLNDAIGVTDTPVRKNRNRISQGFTLDSSDNAMAAGPITIDSGVSVVLHGSFTVV